MARPKGIAKTGGRKKGSLNKGTQAAKDALMLAAEELGGYERIIEWAREDEQNERLFWSSMYMKLLPLQVNANAEVTINVSRRKRDSQC